MKYKRLTVHSIHNMDFYVNGFFTPIHRFGGKEIAIRLFPILKTLIYV